MLVSEYMEIIEAQQKASSAVGICIKLGQQFFSIGVREIDQDILPSLRERAGMRVMARVLPSYAIMLWFSIKVSCTMHARTHA